MKKKISYLLIIVFISFISCNSTDDNDSKSKNIEIVNEPSIFDTDSLKIIAHRGLWRNHNLPENSLSSVKQAIEKKIPGIEFDLHMSKDNVLYLNHDYVVGGYVIKNTDSKILDNLKLSNGEPLTRFTTVINFIKDKKNTQFYVELKSTGDNIFDKQSIVILNNLLIENKLINRSILLSFRLSDLIYLKEVNPNLKTLFLVDKIDNLNLDYLKSLNIYALGLNSQILNNNLSILDEINSKGFRVNLWTINNLNLIDSFKNLKLMSITTDISDKVDLYK